MENEIKVYEVEEVSKILKISEQTIRKLLRNNEIEGIKAGGKWIITEQSLKKFLNIK